MTGTILFEDYSHGIPSPRDIAQLTTGVDCRPIEEIKHE